MTYCETAEKFMVASHVAMALLDLLPINPMCRLAAISAEVETRSEGSVDELSMLYFYEFLIEQLKDLKPQIERGKYIDSIQDCEFFVQVVITLRSLPLYLPLSQTRTHTHTHTHTFV